MIPKQATASYLSHSRVAGDPISRIEMDMYAPVNTHAMGNIEILLFFTARIFMRDYWDDLYD
jgi:hypothetical protein